MLLTTESYCLFLREVDYIVLLYLGLPEDNWVCQAPNYIPLDPFLPPIDIKVGIYNIYNLPLPSIFLSKL